MKAITVVGQVDDEHRLTVDVPKNIPAGPVRVTIETLSPVPDLEEDWWANEVAQSWAQEWSDPREDIYTLEDGEPVNGPG